MRAPIRMIAALVASAAAAFAAAALAPASASAESTNWFNLAPVTFSAAQNEADTYPSTIQVSGQEGPITDVSVDLFGIDAATHSGWSLLLVSPSGDSEMLMHGNCSESAVADRNLTFDQQAAAELPIYPSECPDGTYRPSKGGWNSDVPFTGLPGAPHTADLDHFDNENANGAWRLYAYRYYSTGAESDQIGSGWSLHIETGGYDVDLPAGGASSGPASPYPATRTISGVSGLITDVNVSVNGVFHGYPDDIDMMLEGPGGQKVMLMSDACGGYDVAAYGWTWDDETAAAMPDEGTTDVCGSPVWRPTDRQNGDSLPSPAPAGPYSTGLSAFDLSEPNGEWKLWVADDSVGDEGFISNRFTLQLITRTRAQLNFDSGALTLGEGESAELTVTRSGAASYAPATVDVIPMDGTAGTGDFNPAVSTLEFSPGETEETVEVSVSDDVAREDEETFALQLASPTGDGQLGAAERLLVTIPANDERIDPPDTEAPETTIDRAPAGAVTRRKAKIVFRADAARAHFDCKLDRRDWAGCTSPTRLRSLSRGRHRFRVRAIDAAGNADPTPAKARWRVVRRSARSLRSLQR